MAEVADFIALDVETANADLGSICSIGLVHFRNGAAFKSLTILVDPEDEFDDLNSGIHGIRPEDVAGKPTMAQVFPAISASLTDVVVVHHSHFDKAALARAADKYGTGPLPCAWLDTVRVARRAWPHFNDGGGYGLARLASEFEISFVHHDAAEDARAAGLIMLRAIADSGYSLQDWLSRVELTISGKVPGKFASDGDPSGPLAGETIVFTGALEIPRSIAARAASKMGCNVADGVNKRTTILVVGDQDLRRTKGSEKSSKHRKAEEMVAAGLPLRIVGESDFKLMVGSAAMEDATPERPERISSVAATGIRELVVTLTPEASRIQDLVERVKALKRTGEYAEALSLLLTEIDSQERVSLEKNWGVAPWYYEQAAIIYRKLDDLNAEISILERFMAQRHAPGVGPGELALRLQKARLRQSSQGR
ncbi:exonuclease domain-containing protein [Bradyrhizobium sp. CCBAU 51627]|uniref:exonuclease domain-containing protein n=1 Tax=Bradyrhizobium sp. CCBAU 51627 TaxID=1325088 RepID=UPI0023066400|nr:exonuclease domain-containing protein [Bradyrhizobium sp. CCBAU 51627]